MSRNGFHTNGATLKNAAKRLDYLKQTNTELKNNIELGTKQMQNSLFSLVQGATNQAEITDFTSIAYNNIYTPLSTNSTFLSYMYKTHGIIQATVDMPVLDALRGGLEIHSAELDQDDMKEMQDRLEEGGIIHVLQQAETWTRLYGGGGIIVNVEQDPQEPLDMASLNKQPLELYPVSRWELVAPRRESEFYKFYDVTVHKSRVLTMSGKPAPYLVAWALQGWGMSEVEKIIEPFNAYLRIENVIYALLKEAKVDVFQFENFAAQLMSQAGTNAMISRVQLMAQQKNYSNAVLLDKNDLFEQKQIAFTGLAEIKKQNQIDIASALRIPMTKLFGLSASGFNSGEDDIENYNAMVESEVRQPMRSTVKAILNLLSYELFGDEFDIAWNYKPLRVMSSLDEENIKTQKHARYLSLMQASCLTPQECMEIMQMEKLIPIETAVSKGQELEAPPGMDRGAEEDEEKEEEPE